MNFLDGFGGLAPCSTLWVYSLIENDVAFEKLLNFIAECDPASCETISCKLRHFYLMMESNPIRAGCPDGHSVIKKLSKYIKWFIWTTHIWHMFLLESNFIPVYCYTWSEQLLCAYVSVHSQGLYVNVYIWHIMYIYLLVNV